MHNPQVIAQFKAGRSFETGKLLIPDETKGRLELLYDFQEHELAYRWFDRGTETMEHSLNLRDAEIIRIASCPVGRTIAIRHSGEPRRSFLWIQEQDLQEFGDQYFEKINRKLRELASKGPTKSLPPENFFRTVVLPRIPSYLARIDLSVHDLLDLIPSSFKPSVADLREITGSVYFHEFLEMAIRSGETSIFIAPELNPVTNSSPDPLVAFLCALKKQDLHKK